MKKIIFWALVEVFALSAVAERAAVVYSDWSKATFASEYDKHLKALGWPFDKFQNTRLPELTEKLGDYQFVIATSVANYTQTVKMGPYAAAWRKWLADGGTLIITDANYGSVLGTWVGAFGPEFACSCAMCSAHTKPSDETRVLTLHPDPLADCPKPLGRFIRDNYHQWTHLTKLDAAWHKPVTCVDGAPIFAYRRWGKGLVVLTSAASLKNSPIARALLENVATHRRLGKKGAEILSFESNLDGGSPGRRLARVRLKVEPGRIRKLSASLKARNTSWKGKAATATENTSVMVPANGEVTLDVACAVVRSGKVESKLDVQADGQPLLFCAWEETTPRAVGISLKRKHLYPGNALVAKMAFAEPGRAGVRPSLEGAAWQIDDGAWQMLEAKDGDWTIPVDGLARGAHVFRVKLCYKPGFLESLGAEERNLLDWGEGEEAQFFTHPEPKYRMRGDHVLVENGQPFFPFGFYNVSWTIPAAERLAMAQDVAKWGYNTVHVGMRGDEYAGDGYGAFLDACAKLGIRVITEFDVGRAESVIRKYRGKSAVMGWNPGDEPAPKGITPQEMFRRYDTFKQIDPDHIAYTVICVPSQYANYAAGTDVLAPDPYPVPRRPVDDVYRHFKEAKAAANKVDTALWAVGQAFGGQKYGQKGSWPRWPDAREFRAMSYLSLMAGAKGIIYYTYYDGSFDIRQAPDLLEAVKAFPAEMRGMVPFVLDGKGELLAEDADGVYAMAWTLGTERRLVAVNARDKEVAVVLPFAGTRVLQGAPKGLKVEDGKVSFTLAPLERVVLGR
ncbi:MAG: hypothetical protein IJI36_02805 [Kiritimatiellae bacterium]|nr:hypothetical protein [Kiritimatiellia bacterium]